MARNGIAAAAPSGVQPSTSATECSTGGTAPSQPSDATNTHTGTATTMTASANRAVSSRERRSGSTRALSAIPTRAASTAVMRLSTAEITARIHGAPREIATTTTVTCTTSRAMLGTLTNAASARIAGSRRSSTPNTANRRGSSWSTEPARIGATKNPSTTAELPSTTTVCAAASDVCARLRTANTATSVAAIVRARAMTVRVTLLRSPRSAPSASISLSRRTCATTRGPPARSRRRTAPRSAVRASAPRAPRRPFPRRAPRRRR